VAVGQRRPGEAAAQQATTATEATGPTIDGWSGSTLPITSAHTVRVLAGDTQPGVPPQGDPDAGQPPGR
jgi:hypothetical protein